MTINRRVGRSLKRLVFRFSRLVVGLIILLLWGSSMATDYKTNSVVKSESAKSQVKKIDKVHSNVFKRV